MQHRLARAGERLARLRQEIAAIEGRPGAHLRAGVADGQAAAGADERPVSLPSAQARTPLFGAAQSAAAIPVPPAMDPSQSRDPTIPAGSGPLGFPAEAWETRHPGDSRILPSVGASGTASALDPVTAAEASHALPGGDAPSDSRALPAPKTARRTGDATFGRPGRDGRIALGLADIDAALGGGLPRAGLHEFRAAESRDFGASAGFATALLIRIAATDRRPVLWIEEEQAIAETGLPYGPGLQAFGLDPGALILVRARRPEEALWAFEEGLRCHGLAAAVATVRGHPAALDFTASRRFALRARESGVTGLLLRQSAGAETSAALTRWRVTPRPAGDLGGFSPGIGRAAWRLELERSRLGPTGRFDLEWDHEHRRFLAATAVAGALQSPVEADLAAEADPGPCPADAGDRSPAPPRPRPDLAWTG